MRLVRRFVKYAGAPGWQLRRSVGCALYLLVFRVARARRAELGDVDVARRRLRIRRRATPRASQRACLAPTQTGLLRAMGSCCATFFSAAWAACWNVASFSFHLAAWVGLAHAMWMALPGSAPIRAVVWVVFRLKFSLLHRSVADRARPVPGHPR